MHFCFPRQLLSNSNYLAGSNLNVFDAIINTKKFTLRGFHYENKPYKENKETEMHEHAPY